MTTKRRIVASALGAFSALIGIWLVATRPAAEPRYQGKTVSEWLVTPQMWPLLIPPSPRVRDLRYEAVRASGELQFNPQTQEMLEVLGTNAVPTLLKHLREGRSVRIQLLAKLAASPSLPAWVNNFAASNLLTPLKLTSRAGSALRYLGPMATSAIPELKSLAGVETHHLGKPQAVMTLAGLGTDGWIAIGRVLKNTSPANRASLQLVLQGVSSRALMSGNLRQREEAALALCHLDSPPDQVIPVLVDIAESNDPVRGTQALHGLVKMATNYVTARDAIRQAAMNDNVEIRALAQSILDRAGYTNTIAKQ